MPAGRHQTSAAARVHGWHAMLATLWQGGTRSVKPAPYIALATAPEVDIHHRTRVSVAHHGRTLVACKVN